MITIIVNNDGERLIQREWSRYVYEINKLLEHTKTIDIIYFGSSLGHEQYHKACWVIEIMEGNVLHIYNQLTLIRRKHNQTNLFIIEGEIKSI